MATVPAVPSEQAGEVSASADWNSWASACTYLLGGGTGTKPIFFLMSSAAQSWTTTAQAATWSATASVHVDNDGGWSSSNASRYTVQTPGYWTVDWTSNGGASCDNLISYVLITTTASNLYNPSTTLKVQYNNAAQTTTAAYLSSGGLIPIYLFAGDYLQLMVQGGASSTEGTNPRTHMSGEWVSM